MILQKANTDLEMIQIKNGNMSLSTAGLKMFITILEKKTADCSKGFAAFQGDEDGMSFINQGHF